MPANSPSIALLNPSAAAGRARKAAAQWQAHLPTNCQIIHCKSPEETEAEAHSAAKQNAETIIAIGGDGTIHHVANGILRAPESTSALAVIPCGTANDYWATLKTYAAKANGGALWVDVGEVRQGNFKRFFVNALGIGFSAETAAAALNYKKWPPRLRYLLGVLEALRNRWSLTPAQLQLDENQRLDAKLLLLSIAKGRREGSFTLAKNAQLDDHQLHILTAKDLRRRDVLRYLPGVCFGNLPTSDPRIGFDTCRKIKLVAERPLRFHLDGELLGEGLLLPNEQVDVRVCPERLRIRFLQALG